MGWNTVDILKKSLALCSQILALPYSFILMILTQNIHFVEIIITLFKL